MMRAKAFIFEASFVLLFIVIGTYAIWHSAISHFQVNMEEEVSWECGSNRRLINDTLEQIFGDHLKAEDLTEVMCSKTAYTSDLFVLARLATTADLSGLQMTQPGDWQLALINSAYGQFSEFLPKEGSAIYNAVSGYTSGGSRRVVLMDFGGGRQFVYFEL